MSILTVGDVMSRDPVSVPPDCRIRDAAKIMKNFHIRSLLVKDQGRFVGIITGTDLARLVLAEAPSDTEAVGDIMSAGLITVGREEPLRRANELMIEHHVRHLVVVDGEEPVGIVSVRDLLEPDEDVPGAIPFFPHHLLKEVVAALLMVALLAVLVLVSPAPMLDQADPFLTPEHIKPEWYFLAAYQFLKFAEYFAFLGEWAPKALGVAIMGVVMLVVVFVPFFDRNPSRDPATRRVAFLIGIGATVLFVLFTVWGHFS